MTARLLAVLVLLTGCSDPEERTSRKPAPLPAEDEAATSEEQCQKACRMMHEKVRADLDSKYLDAFAREMASVLRFEILGGSTDGRSGYLADQSGDGAYAGASLDTQIAQGCLDRCKAGWFSSTCIYAAASSKAVRRCVKAPQVPPQ